MKFEGSVAVVTGAASGIGAALAVALAEKGANVVLADVVNASETEAAVAGQGVRCLRRYADVGDANSLSQLAEAAYAEFGKVNFLLANAGVVTFAPILQTPMADWERMLQVNLLGVVNTVYAFVPQMTRQSDDRHVVITASGAGLIASNILPLSAYTASKFAAVGFGECLRLELSAQGIGVSILCPGSVKTGILDTAGYVEEVDYLRPTAAGEPTPGREHVRRAEPVDVAAMVLAAIGNNQPYVVTHHEMRTAIEERLNAQLAACAEAEQTVLG